MLFFFFRFEPFINYVRRERVFEIILFEFILVFNHDNRVELLVDFKVSLVQLLVSDTFLNIKNSLSNLLKRISLISMIFSEISLVETARSLALAIIEILLVHSVFFSQKAEISIFGHLFVRFVHLQGRPVSFMRAKQYLRKKMIWPAKNSQNIFLTENK